MQHVPFVEINSIQTNQALYHGHHISVTCSTIENDLQCQAMAPTRFPLSTFRRLSLTNLIEASSEDLLNKLML